MCIQTSEIVNTFQILSSGNSVKSEGKFHPITGHESPEGEYRYSSTLSLTSALEGVGGQRYGPAALQPGKRPGIILHAVKWAPVPVWAGAENFAPTGSRYPDRPPRSESLYRLRYPGPRVKSVCLQTVNTERPRCAENITRNFNQNSGSRG